LDDPPARLDNFATPSDDYDYILGMLKLLSE
jgi:hypothetical protein